VTRPQEMNDRSGPHGQILTQRSPASHRAGPGGDGGGWCGSSRTIRSVCPRQASQPSAPVRPTIIPVSPLAASVLRQPHVAVREARPVEIPRIQAAHLTGPSPPPAAGSSLQARESIYLAFPGEQKRPGPRVQRSAQPPAAAPHLPSPGSCRKSAPLQIAPVPPGPACLSLPALLASHQRRAATTMDDPQARCPSGPTSGHGVVRTAWPPRARAWPDIPVVTCQPPRPGPRTRSTAPPPPSTHPSPPPSLPPPPSHTTSA